MFQSIFGGILPDLPNSSTMFSAAADLLDEHDEKYLIVKFEKEQRRLVQNGLRWLVQKCDKGLKHLRQDCVALIHTRRLEWLRFRCEFLQGLWPYLGSYSMVYEKFLNLRMKVQRAYSDAVTDLVIFSLSSAEKRRYFSRFHRIYPTSSTVSVIPQSGDKVKSGPYDSSMTVAEGNSGVSNKSNLELGKAGNRLSFQEESNNCQQHGTLTGGIHDARLQVPMAQGVACIYSISMEKIPTAAGSVKCGDPDESSILTKQTCLQEQFVLNSSGDGDSGNPHSNSALRATPLAKTTSTPMLPQLIEVDPQHLRGLSSAAKNNNQQGASILVINGGTGTDGVTIMDSGGAVHCSGNISLFTKLREEPPETKILAANREQMLCFGCGNIRIPSLGLELKGVYYVPCIGNKTIVSVAKLNELDYGVNFSKAVCSIRDETTWTRKLVGKARRVNGQFVLDYLQIPLNRAPVSDGNMTLLWSAAWSRWNSLTKSLLQRHITPSSERLPQ